MTARANLKKEPVSVAEMPGTKRVAILLTALGAEASSIIYKLLTPGEQEVLGQEIARLELVSSDTAKSVLEEFRSLVVAQEYAAVGGIDFVQDLLNRTVGLEKSKEIVSRVLSALKPSGFNALLLKSVDADQILQFVQREHPQTIALVLTQLEPDQAALIINDLAPETQADVIHRLATMDRVSPHVIEDIERVLQTKIDPDLGGSRLGGVKTAAEILNHVGTTAERSILETIGKEDGQLTGQIKNLMFVFEDIVHLADPSIQKILQETDSKDTALALKACSEEIKEKILKNMSERMQVMVQEEVSLMGPVRLRTVEEAQQRIIETIRRLEESDQIVILGGGGEQMVE